jgi:hypothetical protein
MSKKTAPEPPATFVGDQHWGKGGQYVMIDGKRVPAPEEPTQAPTNEGATTTTITQPDNER